MNEKNNIVINKIKETLDGFYSLSDDSDWEAYNYKTAKKIYENIKDYFVK